MGVQSRAANRNRNTISQIPASRSARGKRGEGRGLKLGHLWRESCPLDPVHLSRHKWPSLRVPPPPSPVAHNIGESKSTLLTLKVKMSESMTANEMTFGECRVLRPDVFRRAPLQQREDRIGMGPPRARTEIIYADLQLRKEQIRPSAQRY